MQHKKINWWKTDFTNGESNQITNAISQKKISQGPLVKLFEERIGKTINAPYVVATTSGSVAILMSLMAIGIKPGDEVIIPNRTWISTAHAVFLLGARVRVVDVKKEVPIIDEKLIEEKINKKTRAIMPVYMGGRYANLKKINSLGRKYNIPIVEDSAQAFYSKNNKVFVGTEGDIACFSLSVAKLISTGQGGFIATKKKNIYKKLIALRNNGFEDISQKVNGWPMPGFNFKFNDIQASMGIAQLKVIDKKRKKILEIYKIYNSHFKDSSFLRIIPVNIDSGEIPLYVEVVCERRKQLVEYLLRKNIISIPFYANISRAKYLGVKENFPNSNLFEEHGLYLPCGPDQSIDDILRTIKHIKEFGS